ncbi:MAG TPA: glycosyltransferase [Candidatus Limiplasma sp.]|nr:glycosyltransferase [Candidatus Limiplasma sp.]
MPKVSVIIPVYNVEQYISETIESLLAQSFADFEVIFIDDGSTDSSGDIIKSYIQAHQNFSYFHQIHSYAGNARNLGMENAQGEYLLFLDADDFFDEQMLSETVSHADKTKADIVLFSYDRYHQKDGKYIPQPNGLRVKHISNFTTFSYLDVPDQIFNLSTNSTWTKLFRRSFIQKHNLKFEPLHNANDVTFMLSALAMANRIAWLNNPFVHYRIGLSNNLQAQKGQHPCDFIEAFSSLAKKLRDAGLYQSVEKSFINNAISSFAYNLRFPFSIQDKILIYNRMMQQDVASLRLTSYGCECYTYISDRDLVAGFMSAMRKPPYERKISSELQPSIVKRAETQESVCVSVIMPVFRTEKYLKDALNSIIGQTLKAIEMICINDGSDDQAESILLEYADNDPRITVVCQQNVGLSVTRNRGIDIAVGEYIYFFDSDDILETSALEDLYTQAKASDADMVMFEGECFHENETVKELNVVKENQYIRTHQYPELSGQNLFIRLIDNGEYIVSSCLYILKRDYIEQNHLRYISSIFYEDNVFTFQALMSAQKALCLNKRYYQRRVREDSIVTGVTTFHNSYSYFIVYHQLLAYIQNSELPTTVIEHTMQILNSTLQRARQLYQCCTEENRYEYFRLDSWTQNLFEKQIIEPPYYQNKIADIESKLTQTRNQLVETKDKLQNTKNDLAKAKKTLTRLKKSSGKPPRPLFHLPQKIKKGFNLMRQSGLRAVLRKIREKI